ncbi:uncharacterized protein LOC130759511 [Actinidia eriantha]|uniref:uncharacterized protein LOC130759511 n=1 Tax=Actinidia eriantha TaxID=165200 RepID=UPI00258D13F9|nr:uncharacterized protein LOC130759511 [Actinidia eriantha]
MIAGGNADGKWSGKNMKEEDGLRTMECLRGRLLAERVASRAAKEEAEQMGKKLTELETQLRAEIKSRNSAKKKLKFLLKKMESLNISHVSDHSSLIEKSDISSVSSTPSFITKQPEKSQFTQCGIEDQSVKKTKSPIVSQDLEDSFSQSISSNQSHFCPIEESLSSAEKANSHEKTDDDSSSSLKSSVEKEGCNEANSYQAEDDFVDNSLALVKVDLPKESQPSDPIIVNASVKDVLEALRHAREKLQWSMERRKMIKAGNK